MNSFTELKEALRNQGMECLGWFYGVYAGQVSDNNDPDLRGRLKIVCPAMYGLKAFNKWAEPFGMFTGNKIGFYAIPQIGDPVWVMAQRGDPEHPVWSYGFVPKDYNIEGAEIGKYILNTPLGYRVELNEVDKQIKFLYQDKIYIKSDSESTLIQWGDNTVEMKDKISINFGGVSLKETLDTWLDTLVQAIITTPSGPGNFAPDTITAFQQIKTDIGKLME